MEATKNTRVEIKMESGKYTEVQTTVLSKILSTQVEIDNLLDLISNMEGVDARSIAVARTNMQTGLMWMLRSVSISTVAP